MRGRRQSLDFACAAGEIVPTVIAATAIVHANGTVPHDHVPQLLRTFLHIRGAW